MDSDTNERLMLIEEKIDSIWKSVETTRKYFKITMWVTLAVIVLPLIGLIFSIPVMMKALTAGLEI